jgi:hypothetical protein
MEESRGQKDRRCPCLLIAVSTMFCTTLLLDLP